MKKKIGMALVLFLLIGLFLLDRKSEIVSIDPSISAKPIVSTPVPRAKPTPPTKIETLDPQVARSNLKEKFSHELETWSSFDGDLDMNAKQTLLAARLSENSKLVAASELLTRDPSEAERLFGGKQAEARVLAMKVLIEASKREGPERLERLANKVAEDVAEGRTDKGRGVDLTDLVEGWIRAVGVEKLTSQPHLLPQRLPIKRSLLVPYLRAFEYVYGDLMNDPTFSVRLAFEEGLNHES